MGNKWRQFGEIRLLPSQREGLEANVQIRELGNSSEVLLTATMIKYNYFCCRLYFKALMILGALRSLIKGDMQGQSSIM